MAGVGLTGPEGKEVESLMALPLSAAEYQALKADPELRKLSGDDRTEALGMRMTYEMLAKCDDSLKWGKFRRLPLTLLGKIAERVMQTIGAPQGGGALGES